MGCRGKVRKGNAGLVGVFHFQAKAIELDLAGRGESVIKYSRNIKLMVSNLVDRRRERLQAGCHDRG